MSPLATLWVAWYGSWSSRVSDHAIFRSIYIIRDAHCVSFDTSCLIRQNVDRGQSHQLANQPICFLFCEFATASVYIGEVYGKAEWIALRLKAICNTFQPANFRQFQLPFNMYTLNAPLSSLWPQLLSPGICEQASRWLYVHRLPLSQCFSFYSSLLRWQCNVKQKKFYLYFIINNNTRSFWNFNDFNGILNY